jgi:hypothetical protein
VNCRQQNSELVLRGSKLVLNYTNGSPCDSPSPKSKRQLSHEPVPDSVPDFRSAKIIDDDDDDDDDTPHRKPSSGKEKEKEKEVRRKNTIILLSCQKDPLGPKSPKATISFAGEMDCTYVFEAKSQAACAGIETTPQQLGPGGVFGVMYVSSSLNLANRKFFEDGRILTTPQNANSNPRLHSRWLRLPTNSPTPARLAPTTQLQHVGGYLVLPRRTFTPHPSPFPNFMY